MVYEILKRHKSFGGETLFCKHDSVSINASMNFSIHLPTDVEKIDSAIIWLSGLTCNEENFITKAGVQKVLEGTGTMIICPDTSPRGAGVEGEDDSYDFGTGAGFYVNATTDGYKEKYLMYDYIVKDIVSLLNDEFGVSKISVMGHSMGGHGALVIGLRNSEIFSSISAFSPIVNPVECPWGQKALEGYLGKNKENWENYDSCLLLKKKNVHHNPILIDQGTADEFFEKQLLTKNFENAACAAGQEVIVNYRNDYDHSYYFIASFIEDHIKFHLKHLN